MPSPAFLSFVHFLTYFLGCPVIICLYIQSSNLELTSAYADPYLAYVIQGNHEGNTTPTPFTLPVLDQL